MFQATIECPKNIGSVCLLVSIEKRRSYWCWTICLHSAARLEERESVVIRVLDDCEPSDVRNLFLPPDDLRSQIRSLGEGLVDVYDAEVVDEACLAHHFLVESAHGIVLGGVLVRDEPIVHVSSWHLAEFPAEKLLVESANLRRVVGGNLEVYQCVFSWLRSGCGCCCFH